MNITVAEMKRQVAQLIESNRILVQDLNESRRDAARLGRQRDTLQDAVDRLRSALRAAGEHAAGPHVELEAMRRRLAQELRDGEQMRREHALLLRDAAATRMQGGASEQTLRTLSAQLQTVTRERDMANEQLDEATAALDDVRVHLRTRLGLSELYPAEDPDGPFTSHSASAAQASPAYVAGQSG